MLLVKLPIVKNNMHKSGTIFQMSVIIIIFIRHRMTAKKTKNNTHRPMHALTQITHIQELV